jgi:hypothetical protein
MEFKIEDLIRNTADDLVTNVRYSVFKTDGDYQSSTYGFIDLEKGDAFIPFSELTQETVINWVKEKLDLIELESYLDKQLASQKAPKETLGFPW